MKKKKKKIKEEKRICNCNCILIVESEGKGRQKYCSDYSRTRWVEINLGDNGNYTERGSLGNHAITDSNNKYSPTTPPHNQLTFTHNSQPPSVIVTAISALIHI